MSSWHMKSFLQNLFITYVSSLQWGRKHEQDAFLRYRSLLDDSHTIRKAGFIIGITPCLDASLDGVVEREGIPMKLIVIKCPYSARDISVKGKPVLIVNFSAHCSLIK